VALATLAVNFRHVFYGLSFPYEKLDTRWRRAYGIFALTDETYSLIAGRPAAELNGRRIYLIELFNQVYWVLGCAAGALASVALPSGITGIDFALTALFVVLALDHGRRRTNLVPVVNGAVAGAVAWLFAGDQFLTVAMGMFLLLTIAVFVVRRGKVNDEPDVPADGGGGDRRGDVRAAGGPALYVAVLAAFG
jgi:4-azaleucine resistance transporter AzlC